MIIFNNKYIILVFLTFIISCGENILKTFAIDKAEQATVLLEKNKGCSANARTFSCYFSYLIYFMI